MEVDKNTTFAKKRELWLVVNNINITIAKYLELMFKANIQPDLFTFENQLLGKEQQKLLNKTAEKSLYSLVFTQIDETLFKVLYSSNRSRPNSPINAMITAIVLKERKGWSYDEFMDSMIFDLRTKSALGLISIEENPFSRTTLFNFQNRIAD